MLSTLSLVPTTPIPKPGGVAITQPLRIDAYAQRRLEPQPCAITTNRQQSPIRLCLRNSTTFLCDSLPTLCKSRHLSIILNRQVSSLKTDAKRISSIAGNARSSA